MTAFNNKACKKKVEENLKHKQALELRLAGLTFGEIAEKLNYADESGARKAVNTAMHINLKIPADELRETEVARLDKLISSIWTKARQGNLLAIDRILKLMQRKSKLLGLDLQQQNINLEGNISEIKIKLIDNDDDNENIIEEQDDKR